MFGVVLSLLLSVLLWSGDFSESFCRLGGGLRGKCSSFAVPCTSISNVLLAALAMQASCAHRNRCFSGLPPSPLRILASFLSLMGPGWDLAPPRASILLYGYYGIGKIPRACHTESKTPVCRWGGSSRSLANLCRQRHIPEANVANTLTSAVVDVARGGPRGLAPMTVQQTRRDADAVAKSKETFVTAKRDMLVRDPRHRLHIDSLRHPP